MNMMINKINEFNKVNNLVVGYIYFNNSFVAQYNQSKFDKEFTSVDIEN